ncbi:hypothetical protein BCR35DRAFT_351588 [Leucosporidium creatinivorum]|uniref:Uncharacterized protein n=1 Tax=Leucosporidium creatinivorum TaxID=106004 RepID=A0A1Y2FTL7_9BASI|nr:hypothetical protein BCR35DRAFT_351588 [Leucosporidium creatinivorum]
MLSHSSAALFYGVWIPTALLAFAARAHPQIHGPITIINLITHRRRAGTLQVKPNEEDDPNKVPAVARMPMEVWEQIKGYLLDEIDSEERKCIDKLRCEDCTAKGEKKAVEEGSAEEDESAGSAEAQSRYEWTHWRAPACQRCLKNMLCKVGYPAFCGEEELITNMLFDLNLMKASDAHHLSESDGNTFTAVGLRFRKEGRDGGCYPTLYANADHDGAGLVTVSSFSHDIFKIHDDSSFYHFVSTYRLLTAEKFALNLVPDDNDDIIDEDPLGLDVLSFREQLESLMRDDAGQRESQRGVKYSRKPNPRWMMWNKCGGD